MKRLLTPFVILGLVVGHASVAVGGEMELGVERTASGVPRWAPASEATIHPGVQTLTLGVQCTADFVFFDAGSIYLGQAAHCSGFDVTNFADPCGGGHIPPLGTPVEIQGASRRGTIVYNSYVTMQRSGERDPVTCGANDFALIRLHRSDERKVNPSMPFWGGPVSAGGRSSFGDGAYTYGNSSFRGGIAALMPKFGINTGKVHYAIEDATGWGPGSHGWTHQITTVTPGLPGDSGSPVLDAEGRALGILSSISLDGSSGISDLGRMMEYMKAKTNLDKVRLATGTTSFWPL